MVRQKLAKMVQRLAIKLEQLPAGMVAVLAEHGFALGSQPGANLLFELLGDY